MFSTGRVKKYLMLGLGFSVCAFIYICFFYENTKSVSDSLISVSVNLESESVLERKTLGINGISVSSPERLESDVAIVNSWLEQNGIGGGAFSNYQEAYSSETLEDFVSAGDVTAADALALKYMSDGEIDKAHAIADKGILLGSYNAIRMMANRYSPALAMDDSELERQEKRESLLQYFVYLKFLQLRGGEELFSSQALREYYLSNFKDVYGENQPLSTVQYKLIDEKAEALYESYETRRIELGWGTFDNDTAKDIHRLFMK